MVINGLSGTKKAIKYSVRIAQAFKIGIEIIFISKDNVAGSSLKAIEEWAAKFLRRNKINFKSSFEFGDAEKIINKKSDKNHILIMSSETSNPLKTFFRGNTPLKILKDTQSSVLIVK